MKKLPEESKFGNIFGAVIDLFFAGILWFICSLPIITLGSASVALYYSIVKCVRHERGRVAGSFFSAFRSNFLPATKVWFLYLGYVLLCLSYLVLSKRMEDSFPAFLGLAAQLMLIPALLPLPWIFPYISRFENSTSATLKYALYLSIKNFSRTLLLVFILAATLLLCWMMPALIPVMPGLVCLFMSYFIEPVFRILAQNSEDSNADRWYNE